MQCHINRTFFCFVDYIVSSPQKVTCEWVMKSVCAIVSSKRKSAEMSMLLNCVTMLFSLELPLVGGLAFDFVAKNVLGNDLHSPALAHQLFLRADLLGSLVNFL